jgi:T3SS negative regulator,GrlR
VIKNGIYAFTALAIDGAGVDAGGVLILHDGRIHGGDSFVYYVGTYNCSDGKWSGGIVSREHTPTTRPIAERVQSIEFSGTYNDDGAEADATAVVGKQRIRYDATLRLLTTAA